MVNFGSPTKLSGRDKAISTEQLAALAARTPRGDASTQLRRNASAKLAECRQSTVLSAVPWKRASGGQRAAGSSGKSEAGEHATPAKK